MGRKNHIVLVGENGKGCFSVFHISLNSLKQSGLCKSVSFPAFSIRSNVQLFSSWILFASFNSPISFLTASSSTSTDLSFVSKTFFSVSSLSILSFRFLISLFFESTVILNSSFCSRSSFTSSFSRDISSFFCWISFLRKAIYSVWLVIISGS